MFKSIFSLLLFCMMFNAVAQDWDAAHYRNHSNIQYNVAKQLLTAVNLDNTSPQVLDVGCGDGRVTNELVLKYLNPKKVIAIDPSPSMLQIAKQTYQTNPKLQFLPGSFQSLNEQNKYDVITSFFAQHWVPEEEQALAIKNTVNALKTGGLYITAHVVNSKKFSLRHAIQVTAQQNKWKTYFPNYKPPVYPADPFELQQLLTNNHLRLKRFVTIDYTTQFDNDTDFFNWIMGWSPYKTLLGEKHKAFWDEVITTYRKQTQQVNKSNLTFQDFYIEVIAEKMSAHKIM